MLQPQPQNWDEMFKDENFVKTYKIAEGASGPFGEVLIEQSGIVAEAKANPEKPLVILDDGCGTGIISEMLVEKVDAQAKSNWKLTCCDISEAMVEYTRRRAQSGRWPNVDFKIVDAQETGLASDYYTHVLASFVLMALPKSLAALDVPWLEVAGKAVASLDGNLLWPTVEEFLAAMGDKNWRSSSWIESQLQQRGFIDINVKPVTKSLNMTVPDFLQMTSRMLPMITKGFWSDEQRQQFLGKVSAGMEKYVVETYGANGDITRDWTAIVSTARKA
ncbi:hypothetical protein N7468_005636 [Penicillium chermesinum]|uniref:Methyltransferase domain-containing protein n=1 Tax=Penicillium chermesinum TaxID=63820 RepID=A0A9W9P068_9EURO|nr:uncharacterized protein N7468_005636 [Penicillium chermesinum]KAJ5232680.1 hypothetical protein N7468_005636 [Penicillium chermesinum]